MRGALPFVCVLMACGGDGGGGPDGPPPGGNALAQVLYVQTEGVTLKAGADDATMDTSSLVDMDRPLRRWLGGAAGRAARLDALLSELRMILAPYGVDVVNTRPMAGPYDMVVITDDTSIVAGLPNGVLAATPTSCNQTPSVPSIVFAGSLAGTGDEELRHIVAAQTISMLGIAAGIPASSVARDCMCLSASPCGVSPTGPCTIGGPGTTVDPVPSCPAPDATMDEASLFLAAFGAR